jgi:NAD+ kinase
MAGRAPRATSYAAIVGHIGAVGLVLHPKRDCAVAVDLVTRWAASRGVAVFGVAGELDAAIGVQLLEQQRIAQHVDLLVSLGGDGTMLRTLRLAYHHQVPVLGVNLGKFGFLAEIEVPELDNALGSIAAERFEVESRVAVEAMVGDTVRVAFNDIALVRIPGRGQAAVGVVVDGQPFVRYVADAVVVSTPTGSTAYSFSAGGPIVSPKAQGLLVVPVAPHSTFNRALMLACSESLSLELLASSGSLAFEVDGELVRTLEPGQQVKLLTNVAAGSVVRLGTTTFYQRAQRKLRLSDAAELG